MAFTYTGFADEADKTLNGQIAVLKEAGWSSVELRLVDGKSVCDQTQDEWLSTRDRLAAAGIGIAGFGGQVANWARPITTPFEKDTDEIRRVAPRMRAAGISLLRIMSYPNATPAWPVPEWKAEVFRRLRELCAIATGEGILLGHENCNGYGGIGPDQCLEMLEEVNSPALTLIFDTGNNTLHDHDMEATWRYYTAVRPHITHVHVKAGKPGADGKYATCYPDEDPVQSRIFADLLATGYDGYLSIEPHLKAAIHAGKDVTDADGAKLVWLEYTRRIENMVAAL